MRIDPSDVREVFDTSLETNSIERHIQAANRLTNDISNRGSVDQGRLELIETYLAAHFCTVQDPLVREEGVGSASWDYQRTEYWDMAEALDPTGTLNNEISGSGNIYVPDGRNIG